MAGAATSASPVPTKERLTSAVSAKHGRRDYIMRRLLATADALSIVLALVATFLITGNTDPSEHLVWGLATVPVWILVFKIYGL